MPPAPPEIVPAVLVTVMPAYCDSTPKPVAALLPPVRMPEFVIVETPNPVLKAPPVLAVIVPEFVAVRAPLVRRPVFEPVTVPALLKLCPPPVLNQTPTKAFSVAPVRIETVAGEPLPFMVMPYCDPLVAVSDPSSVRLDPGTRVQPGPVARLPVRVRLPDWWL